MSWVCRNLCILEPCWPPDIQPDAPQIRALVDGQPDSNGMHLNLLSAARHDHRSITRNSHSRGSTTISIHTRIYGFPPNPLTLLSIFGDPISWLKGETLKRLSVRDWTQYHRQRLSENGNIVHHSPFSVIQPLALALSAIMFLFLSTIITYYKPVSHLITIMNRYRFIIHSLSSIHGVLDQEYKE